MKKIGVPSSERIIKDIEFEVLLGAIPQENFGEAILSIKSYKNRVHSDVLETLRDPRMRDAFSKVFQVQEMLIVLLQEMIAVVSSLQAYLPEIVKHTESLGLSEMSPPAHKDGESALSELFVGQDEIAKLLVTNFLKVDSEVRPVRLPLIGGLLGSVRIALHNLVLFYVNRLGAKQAQINRIYGEQIQKLLQIIIDQQEQINALTASVNDLQSQILSGGEG